MEVLNSYLPRAFQYLEGAQVSRREGRGSHFLTAPTLPETINSHCLVQTGGKKYCPNDLVRHPGV